MFKSIFLFILSALFLFFEMGLQVSPGIMTQDLMYSFNIDIFWLGIMSGSYFIAYTIMQIPAGLMYDSYSVRSVIIFSTLICIIGGFLFATVSNFYLATIARIIVGLGSAFAFIGVLVIAKHVFPEKYFSLSAGIAQMLAAMGAMCGTMPLISLLNTFGWRVTMIMINGFGLVLLIFIYIFLHLPNKKVSTSFSIKNLIIILCKIAKNSQTWFIAVYACLLWVPMSVVASLYGIPFVEQYFNISFTDSVSVITFMWIGIACGSPIIGFISDKSKKLKFPIILTSIIGVIAFFLILFMHINNIFILMFLFFLSGISCTGQILSFSLINKNNKPEYCATAIGFNNMAVVISGFIFQPLIGFIIRYNSTHNNYMYFNGMLIVLLGYFIATVVSIFFIKYPKYDKDIKF